MSRAFQPSVGWETREQARRRKFLRARLERAWQESGPEGLVLHRRPWEVIGNHARSEGGQPNWRVFVLWVLIQRLVEGTEGRPWLDSRGDELSVRRAKGWRVEGKD